VHIVVKYCVTGAGISFMGFYAINILRRWRFYPRNLKVSQASSLSGSRKQDACGTLLNNADQEIGDPRVIFRNLLF